MPRKPRDVSEEVEILIDDLSLAPLLIYLMQVCDEKAHHIEEDWQDYALAKRWEQAARIIDIAAAKIEKLHLS